jgi:hypothetical protein
VVRTRPNWGVEYAYFVNEEGGLESIPSCYTSLVEPDLFSVLSAGRALFRVEDLLALGELTAGLRGKPVRSRRRSREGR